MKSDIHCHLLSCEGFHPYGDNGSAWGMFAEFARRWNESGTRAAHHHRHAAHVLGAGQKSSCGFENDPRRLDGLLELWLYLLCQRNHHRPHHPQPPVPLRCAFCRPEYLHRRDAEFAENTETSAPLRLCGKWSEALTPLPRLRLASPQHVRRAYLGRGHRIQRSQLEDSLAMDNHKKNLAYTARSLSLLLERDALADFSQHISPALM